MNRFFLFLVMLPAALYRWLGADVPQLRAILRLKLTLDDRRPLKMGGRKQKKPARFTTFWSMTISAVTGFLYVMPMVALEHNFVLAVWIYFSVFLFFLCFSLITDFSNVLIDNRDTYTILPRPVSSRTLFLSRLLHILIYVFRIVLPMSLPGWLIIGFMFGLREALWFPLPLLLLILTAVFVVMAIYLLLLWLAPAAKFKNIISNFQVAFSICVIAFYYLSVPALRNQAITTLTTAEIPGIRATPSYWLAATWRWFGDGDFVSGTSWLAILAVVLPVICFFVTLRWLAPAFSARLAGIDPAAGPKAVAVEKSAKNQDIAVNAGTSLPFWKKLSSLLNRSSEAEAGFLMGWLQSGRSRAFRMKVYPSVAYIPMYFIFLLTNNDASISEVWRSLPQKPETMLLLLYLCSFVLLQAINYLNISEQYKAAWIYYTTPISEPGRIMGGAFKAVAIKFFLPFYLAIAAFAVAIWGLPAIGDILLAGINVLVIAVSLSRISFRHLPFSVMDDMNSKTTKFARIFLTMAIPGTLGFTHYLVQDILWLKLLVMGLSSCFLWLIWGSYVGTTWDVIKRAE